MTPAIGARTDESRRFTCAERSAWSATSRSAFAVSVFVLYDASSSPGMRPGFLSLAPSRRATIASLSPSAASALSSAAFADATAR